MKMSKDGLRVLENVDIHAKRLLQSGWNEDHAVARALKEAAALVLEAPLPETSPSGTAKVPEGMVLVSKRAVEVAWRIAKERRDELATAAISAEHADQDLEVLSEGGMDKHLPTIDEVRAAWNSSPAAAPSPDGNEEKGK